MRIEYMISGECERLEDVPKNAEVLRVDDQDVIAKCESCGGFIFDGEDFESCDEDGVYLCRKCAEELRAEQYDPPRYVTHEMALDAGEPEREGMEY